MRTPDERAAWEDSFNEAQRPRRTAAEPQSGWYGTACAIATGLVTLWALYGWLPVN